MFVVDNKYYNTQIKIIYCLPVKMELIHSPDMPELHRNT